MNTVIAKRPVIVMTPVTSSQIHAIGHNPEENILAIQFKSKSGASSVYHYANFTTDLFAAFKNAKSAGSHFKSVIRDASDRFPYLKVS